MKHNAYPEIVSARRSDIDPGAWTVNDTPTMGAVDLTRREYNAPLHSRPCPRCGVDHARGVRRHEMAHVSFTPENAIRREKRAKLPHGICNAVEDVRIYERARSRGLTLDAPVCPDMVGPSLERLQTIGDTGELIELFTAYFCSEPTGHAALEWLWSRPPGPLRDVLETARAILDYGIIRPYAPVFKDTLETAKRLEALKPAAAAALAKELATDDDDTAADSVPSKDFKPGTGSDLWCPMRVMEPPLPRRASVQPMRKWSARDEGSVPVNMHRFVTDGAVFRVPTRKQQPVTLLVDVSSSMDWNYDDLTALLERSPASQIAVYSGDGDRAALAVVARNGKRTSADYHFPYTRQSNSCDGLALEWLARQPGKRVWLTDGAINGATDDRSALVDDCRRIIRAGRIMRVETAETAIAVASGKLRHRPSRINPYNDYTVCEAING